MWRGNRCFHHIQGIGMMPIIPATRAKAEGEGVPPSSSRYRYDAYYPSYQSKGRGGGGATIIFKVWVCCLPSQLPERRWRGRGCHLIFKVWLWCLPSQFPERRSRGRGCHHHIQGMGMMSTIPATGAEVEVVPPSYSRYRYEVYHPRYQSMCSVEAIHPADIDLYSCRYLPIYC